MLQALLSTILSYILNTYIVAYGQFHLPGPITAGYYPGDGQVEIRLSADPDDKALLETTHYELQQLFSEFLALADAPDD